jgi:hypothetical protein
MNRAQRIVLVLYCLLLAYCCLWVPWRIPFRNSLPERVGYGWLWAGPAEGHGNVHVPPPPSGFTIDPEPRWERARPDLELIAFRLVAVTSIAAAGFLLSGMLRKPSS